MFFDEHQIQVIRIDAYDNETGGTFQRGTYVDTSMNSPKRLSRATDDSTGRKSDPIDFRTWGSIQAFKLDTNAMDAAESSQHFNEPIERAPVYKTGARTSFGNYY